MCLHRAASVDEGFCRLRVSFHWVSDDRHWWISDLDRLYVRCYAADGSELKAFTTLVDFPHSFLANPIGEMMRDVDVAIPEGAQSVGVCFGRICPPAMRIDDRESLNLWPPLPPDTPAKRTTPGIEPPPDAEELELPPRFVDPPLPLRPRTQVADPSHG